MFRSASKEKDLKKYKVNLRHLHYILFDYLFYMFENFIDLKSTKDPREEKIYYRDGEKILTGTAEQIIEKRRYLCDEVVALNYMHNYDINLYSGII